MKKELKPALRCVFGCAIVVVLACMFFRPLNLLYLLFILICALVQWSTGTDMAHWFAPKTMNLIFVGCSFVTGMLAGWIIYIAARRVANSEEKP